MTEIYRFRREVRFARPPAAIWPFVSDSARLWEFSGMAPYRFEERVDGKGRVRRFVRGKVGPFQARWEEDFGEWQDNHRLFQARNYRNGPMRRWEWACELVPEGAGCRLIVTGMAEPAGLLGFVGKHAGVFDAEFGKAAAAIERIVHESDSSALVPGWSVKDLAEPAARQRLDALGAELARDPASHELGPNLIDFLRHAPIVDVRSLRPVALARLWSVPADHSVELFLAAARKGIVAMGWELLCPRCRGAKSRVSRLQDLPKGAHCFSCNIDYERNFSRNVELTFHPEPWIRPLPDGEMCMLGQGSARHIKFQAEVAAQSAKAFDLSLAPGPYRFRTVEAGGEADRDIGADGVIPKLVARGGDIFLEGACGANELAIRNETDRPLVFVVENRNWAKDALTGDRVIAMPAFRRLCPEQLLRPGDNAEIGWIAIMFTDLKGSTELYDALGDAPAYNLVCDHFSFLSDRVQRNHGFVVKTVGDAVMAAFSRPDHAVRAALAIQDDLASFNSARGGGAPATPIALKLGLHAGPCISVTTGDVLDYFGATVNIAARLEHQCRGGEVLVSEAVAQDAEAAGALADRTRIEETATLRGVSAPVRFVRIAVGADADRVRRAP
ncbi:MAG TPA: adenylate/guanylate cyclase domain-containing protein [Roseiarcus sp.]